MLYKILVFIVRIIIFPLYRVEIIGFDNIPKEGTFVFCANHASYLDPVFLAGAYKKPIRFMAKKELFDHKIFGWIITKLGAFPANRGGRDLKTLRYAISLIKNGEMLGIFPEGTRVRKVSRESIKDGAGFIALKAKADVVVCEIISDYKPFHKTKLIFKKKLPIGNYLSLSSKEATAKIMDDSFKEMYEFHKSVLKVRKD